MDARPRRWTISGRLTATRVTDVAQYMKSMQNRNVEMPRLSLVLIAVVICFIAAVLLIEVGGAPQDEATIPVAGLQAAPTAMTPPIAPAPVQADNSWFPPRSDLGSRSWQASGDDAIPGVRLLGAPPASAPVSGPPSFTGKPGTEPRNPAGVTATPVEWQMRVEPPSATDKMIVQSPRSTEMAGVVMLHGVPGPGAP